MEKKNLLHYTFLFITLTTVLVLVACVFGKMNNFENNSDAYNRGQEAITSWNAGFVDALFVTTSASCASGTTQIHGFRWPGSVAICSCPFTEGVGSYFNIKEGACSAADLTNGCSNHAENTPTDFNSWKGGAKVCARYSTNTFANENQDCPSATHKFCGSNNDTKVCIPSADACPITYASFQSSNASNASLLLSQVDATNYLVRGNLDNHFPITSFQMQVQKSCKPWCSTSNTKQSVKKYSFAKNDSNALKGADATNPSNIQIVDSLGEKDYYTNNNVLATVSGLPGYPRVTNELQYQIASVHALEWKKKCRQKEGYTLSVITDRLNLEREEPAYLWAFIIVLLTWLVVLVVVPLKDYYFSKTGTSNKTVCTICTLVQELLKLGSLTVVIIAFYVSFKGEEFFYLAADKDCTSAYGEAAILSDYEWTHELNMILYSVALGFIIVVVLYDIICLAIDWKEKMDSKNGKKSESEPKKKSKAKSSKKAKAQAVEVEMSEMDKSVVNETDIQLQTQLENAEEGLNKPPEKDFIDNIKDGISNLFNMDNKKEE